MACEKEKEAIKALLENDEAIKCIVENIMKEFDKDNSGTLEMDETKALIKHFLSQSSDFSDGSEIPIPDELYQNIFNAYDTDGSGSIDSMELTDFIKQLLSELVNGPPKDEGAQ